MQLGPTLASYRTRTDSPRFAAELAYLVAGDEISAEELAAEGERDDILGGQVEPARVCASIEVRDATQIRPLPPNIAPHNADTTPTQHTYLVCGHCAPALRAGSPAGLPGCARGAAPRRS